MYISKIHILLRSIIAIVSTAAVPQRYPNTHCWATTVPLRDTESEAYHPRREPVPAAAQRPRPPDCEVSEANSRNSSLGSHATRKTPVSSIHWCYISESAPPRSVPDIRPAPPAHLPFYSAHYRLSKISP